MEIHKIIYVLCEKKTTLNIIQDTILQTVKTNKQLKHKPNTSYIYISTTFVIYLHQTIIQTNMGQTVISSECKILPII